MRNTIITICALITLVLPTTANATPRNLCATLQATDQNNDGAPEYNYDWNGIAGFSNATGTWNGTSATPNRPIPLIARLAAYGSAIPNSRFERHICMKYSPRLLTLGTAQPLSIPNWTHPVTYQTHRTPWGSANHAAYTQFLAEQKQRSDDAWNRDRQITADRQAAERAALIARQQAEWKLTCTAGSTVKVQYGVEVVIWTC